MHKFVIALVLVALIALENWIWPGWIAFTYRWTIGFMPWYIQVPLFVVASAALAFAAGEFLGGIIGLPVLAVLAVMPLLGIKLGWVDEKLGDVAYNLAANGRDVQEVAQVHWYLHSGVLIAGALLVLAVVVTAARVVR